MIPVLSPEVLALAPEIAGLGSWIGDIVERMTRGILSADAARAELRQRYADTDRTMDELEAGLRGDRAVIDARIDRLPSAAPPAAPRPADAPAPGAVPIGTLTTEGPGPAAPPLVPGTPAPAVTELREAPGGPGWLPPGVDLGGGGE